MDGRSFSKNRRRYLSKPQPASGAFSWEYNDVIDLNRLGALVAKTICREPRLGNPTPRMAETEAGIIQSIGLPGKGIDYFVENIVPEYARFKPPLVVSVSSESIEDFAALSRELSVPDVDVIECNISCPTRNTSGGNFALQEEHTKEVMTAIREATDKPSGLSFHRMLATLSPSRLQQKKPVPMR